METLQRLTHRQLEALQRVASLSAPEKGVGLERLAGVLRVSPPTALAHLTVIERRGLVERSRGKTRISRRGLLCLKEYMRHHRIAETLFAKAGFAPKEACEAAREIDMALSHRVVDKICQAEKHPQHCPHGQPIDPCEAPA